MQVPLPPSSTRAPHLASLTVLVDPLADDAGSVIKRAEHLAGRRIFICHGTGDDNVHFQHTVMLVNRLVELGNLDFDMMIYPNRQHGIAANGAKRHIYHELWQWLAAELQL